MEDVAVDEMRRELQEGSWAGDAGRGRYCWRNSGLELGAREEWLEELLGLKKIKKGVKKKHKQNKRKRL